MASKNTPVSSNKLIDLYSKARVIKSMPNRRYINLNPLTAANARAQVKTLR